MTQGPWTLEIPAPVGGRIWSSNDDHRAHHMLVAARRKHARWTAKISALAGKVPCLDRARVEITVHIRNWQRADAANYPGGSTVKGILDGLVDAGVVPDDRQEFLDVQMPRLAALDGGVPRVVLVIHEVPEEATA